jgi:antitoxin VapB
MALSIKDPEADRLARELAEATGESLTQAVTNALRDRLRLIRAHDRTKEQRLADALKIVEEFSKRRVADGRSADEILGYDERGLPS